MYSRTVVAQSNAYFVDAPGFDRRSNRWPTNGIVSTHPGDTLLRFSSQVFQVDCHFIGDPTPTELANFDENQRHVVGEGTVPPCGNAVENCFLHIRKC